MKSIKAELTKLKNSIEKNFSKDDEIFPDIVPHDIATEIDELYFFLDKIGETGNSLGKACLKRVCLKYIRDASRLSEKNSLDNFDKIRFINALVSLRSKIKETFLIEVNGEFRSEKELAAISHDIEAAKSNLAEYISLQKHLKQDEINYETLKSNLKLLFDNYQARNDEAEKIEQWHSALEPLNNKIISYEQVASAKLAEISTLETTAKQNAPKVIKYQKEIEMLNKKFHQQKEDIQAIIEDANRASMAGAFKKQSDDINRKMQWADSILIVSLILSSAISYWGFKSSYIDNHFNWIQFIAKVSITVPFLIIAWIKARERSYLFQIREDYAYKYSSAMAFEGYKRQIQEQDPDLQQELLQIALGNLGEKPTKVFDKELKSTPLEAIMDSIGKRIDKTFDALLKEIKDSRE